MDRTDPQTVGDVMTTDLLTVGPDERVDLAAVVMDRRHIRQLLVVDDDGLLLGLVSYRALLRLLTARRTGEIDERGPVRPFMAADPVVVTAATPLRDAIRVMLERDLSAVPVVEEGRPVGILSEHDVVDVARRLLHAPDPVDR